ncbi:hypothetical protein GLOIN_2v1709121 [Rhizophagus clarus]|uniref:Uncharacterized protein n=1 Tax=Rhizophagus clarus TaxID=94130 RepID=A0A8H3L468_9GLOM|nr:hypothetical protein GLOIN_2v1709121 [Rhizophagus clarus]
MSDIAVNMSISTSSIISTGNKDLGISGKAFKILENKEAGPALVFANFTKECKKKKFRIFLTYKTKKDLKEVLCKYSIDNNDMKNISPFIPEKISDGNKDFQYYLVNIKRKMKIIGLAKSSNKAVRYSYIKIILLSAIFIVKKIVNAKIFLKLQFEVINEEATEKK